MNGDYLPRYLVITGYLQVILILKKEFGLINKIKILVFGCGGGRGRGRGSQFFQIYFPSENYIGTDISIKMIEDAKRINPNGKYVLYSNQSVVRDFIT